MQERNSSQTRVRPVFDRLLSRDPTSISWLPRLLTLPNLAGRPPLSLMSRPQPLTESAWYPMEKPLKPAPSLLEWMVQHGDKLEPRRHDASMETRVKRQALLHRDPTTITEAMACLSRLPIPSIAWYVLEGITRPDVYLKTPDVLVVIEGKRTERYPKLYTDWMSHRHQMLRHMDCAWEVRGSRTVLGFFIVEGQGGAHALDVPSRWQSAARATIAPTAIKESLPHRTPTDRQAIADSFLGVTTWQQVCATFQIDYDALPDTVEEGGGMRDEG
jgi:hypothetical protein